VKAFTVRQPYAGAIVWQSNRYGPKRIENRSKPIPEKYIGETTLLHAAKDPHASGITAADLTDQPWPDVRSAILAVVRFAGSHRVVDGCCAPWGHVETGEREVWHWKLDDHVQRLTKPVPASGALGFWTPPDNVLTAVHAQLEETAK
jgi:hypothetical protein